MKIRVPRTRFGRKCQHSAKKKQVANAVQQMLQLADRNGGIGEQVRINANPKSESGEDRG